MHTRRRYHLVPSPNAVSTNPPIDPNLWIFHYTRAEAADQLPVNTLPVNESVHRTQRTRSQIAQLQQFLGSKEFHLQRPETWPTIQFPQMPATGGKPAVNITPQRMAPGNTRNSAGPYYPPPGAPTPSAKRHKSSAGPPNMPPQAPSAVMPYEIPPMTIDEEEDTSKGDMFDHLTPRDIATQRFTRQHEWLEEVMSSAYAIHKIEPVPLQFSLMGELAEVTKGIFDLPSSTRPSKKDILELETRERNYIAKQNEEIRNMTAMHEQRMAEIRGQGDILVAEKALRAIMLKTTLSEPQETAPEGDNTAMGGTEYAAQGQVASEEDIVAQVERVVGKNIVQRDSIIKWHIEDKELWDAKKHEEDTEMDTARVGPQYFPPAQPQPSASTSSVDMPQSGVPSHTSSGVVGSSNPADSSGIVANDNTGSLDEDTDMIMDEPTNFDDAFGAMTPTNINTPQDDIDTNTTQTAVPVTAAEAQMGTSQPAVTASVGVPQPDVAFSGIPGIAPPSTSGEITTTLPATNAPTAPMVSFPTNMPAAAEASMQSSTTAPGDSLSTGQQ